MTYTLAGSKQTAIALETSQMGAGPGDCYKAALEASLEVELGRLLLFRSQALLACMPPPPIWAGSH